MIARDGMKLVNNKLKGHNQQNSSYKKGFVGILLPISSQVVTCSH